MAWLTGGFFVVSLQLHTTTHLLNVWGKKKPATTTGIQHLIESESVYTLESPRAHFDFIHSFIRSSHFNPMTELHSEQFTSSPMNQPPTSTHAGGGSDDEAAVLCHTMSSQQVTMSSKVRFYFVSCQHGDPTKYEQQLFLLTKNCVLSSSILFIMPICVSNELWKFSPRRKSELFYLNPPTTTEAKASHTNKKKNSDWCLIWNNKIGRSFHYYCSKNTVFEEFQFPQDLVNNGKGEQTTHFVSFPSIQQRDSWMN